MASLTCIPWPDSNSMLRYWRSLRRHWLRIFLLLFILGNFFDILRIRHKLFLSTAHGSNAKKVSNQKIFIASTHWNNEAIIREHWNDAILALVNHFGAENVYISIYESGSWDDTKGALQFLDERLEALKVQRTVVLDPTTHEDEIAKPPASSGWIQTPRGKLELRRIPYLAALRNLSLKPFHDLAGKGYVFDKILFLNDVVFTINDVETLLNTNEGVYSAACALDFSKPPKYYDTFALRDSEGQEPVMQVWPYFQSRKSRSAMKTSSSVPVSSCWNGMVFMDASPFYTQNTGSSPPLQFRGITDSLAGLHLEGSECCLIHADNPLTSTYGVWLNPNVRVGYNGKAYEATHPDQQLWLSTSQIFFGLWKNRFIRWWPVNWIKTWSVNWMVDSRVSSWMKAHADHYEPGRNCLINEMQVLVWNGWAHV